ncbi:cellulose synthase subunit BcsC [Blastopirellula retiformator]|uniref:Cellulose synthase subunit BcsC n=1 Tax=Blastopirellula retiformator TaxID=2527970 RepID=A0A5C5V305_9BACT|nr:cellulose synthase subunit BcsC [Blastopirellula retiformator]
MERNLNPELGNQSQLDYGGCCWHSSLAITVSRSVAIVYLLMSAWMVEAAPPAEVSMPRRRPLPTSAPKVSKDTLLPLTPSGNAVNDESFLKSQAPSSPPSESNLHLGPRHTAPIAEEILPSNPIRHSLGTDPNISNDLQHQVLLEAARNAVALGDLNVAAERFETLLNSYPHDLEGRLEFAGILLRLGRQQEAIANYRQVLKLDPRNTQASLTLADLLIGQHQLEEANALLASQLQLDPNNVSVALRLASVFLQMGHRAAAMETLHQSVLKNQLSNADRILAAKVLRALNDPTAALQMLAPLIQHQTLGHDGLKLALRCQVSLGNYDAMQQLAAQYTEAKPDNISTLLELSSDLLDEEDSLAALFILEIIATQVPPDSEVLTLLARARVAQYQLPLAQLMIEEFKHLIPERDRILLWGEILQRSGNYLEAISDFEQILLEEPNNRRAIYGKAQLLQALGQYDAAEATLRCYSQTFPQELGPRFRLAQLLIDQQHLDQAEFIYQEIIAEEPGVVFAYRGLLRLLIRQQRYDEAAALIHQLQRTRPFEPLLTSTLRIEQGLLLAKLGQAIEAIELLRNHEPASRTQLPDGFLVMYQAACFVGEPSQIEAAKASLLGCCGQSLELSIRMSDEALAQCLDSLAACILEQASQISSGQISIAVRLADAYAAGSCMPDLCRAAEIYRSVITLSPTNARARIGLARVLLKMDQPVESAAIYARLNQDMPTFVTARREYARVTYAVDGRRAGDAVYSALLRDAPSAASMSVQPIHVGPALTLSARQPNPMNVTSAISLERQAKSCKDWRPSQAICDYQSLIAVEPANEDAYFDLGQQYLAKRRTCAAMNTYKELLYVNPCNQPAGIALSGISRDVQPRGTFDFLYFGQSGRNGLANINRVSLEWGAEIPLGDVDQFLRFDYAHLIYDPKTTDTVLGNSFGAGIHQRFWDDFRYFAEMDVQVFDDGFSPRPVFNTGVSVDTWCDGRFEIGGFLENVAENSESIAQDIYMGGGRLAGCIMPTSWWTAQSRYRFSGYSDHNVRHDLFVHNRVQLMKAPHELNLLADYDFLSFDEGSIFGPGPGIAGTVHPYFAPSGFSQVSLGLEYKLHLSRYDFEGAPQRWVSLEYRGQWDSQGQFYNIGRVRGYCDIYGRLAAGVETSLTRSAVYNNDVAYAYLILWFP